MFRLVDKSSGYLFSSIDLSDYLRDTIASLRSEVESIDANRLLNTSPADLADYLCEKYRVEAPVLRRQDWVVDSEETRVDVRHDPRRWIEDRSRPALVPGQRIKVEVPFDGEPELFYARPNTFTLSPPRAKVAGQSLVLVYEVPHDVQSDLRLDIERTLNDIESYLRHVREQVEKHNESLPKVAAEAIEHRRQRLLEYQGRVAVLGIPLKQRSDAPKTYAVPTIRRKVVPSMPEASSLPYTPEPTLDLENYEHILRVLQNMAEVMERSPSAFSKMGEEDLRQHFLVQLNGQFEGKATGETFNVSGKTDILLREGGRNVFIAECKFWRGPKHYRETIDQLLSYSAWRDTKTAILLFNRGGNLSTVLQRVQEETKRHSNFKREVKWDHDTGFRYVFHHHGDRNRELLLTVLVFDVPGPEVTPDA